MTSRNDDFGGDMLRRLRLFVENVMALCDRHLLPAEVIVVEWNPPEGPRLHDVLRPARKSQYVALRFIEVPARIHEALPTADMMPLFQMIAKNVGIRRARGEFVVATNQDILFSDELMRQLATLPLDPDVMYRIDRTDVAAEVPDDLGIDDQLEWCKHHILRVHGRWGTMETEPFWELGWLRDALVNRVAPSRARQTSPLARDAWGRLKELAARQFEKFRQAPVHRLRTLLSLAFKAASRLVVSRAELHTNACGDFTMLARQRWQELRGYPEIPLYSLHIDSFLCHVAEASGLRERVLRSPARLYHLEHESSWAVLDPPGRIEWFASRPWLEWGLISSLADHMKREGPYLYNDADWGYGSEDFDETWIHQGERFSGQAPRNREEMRA